ncbi:MAG: hypothetical protein ACRCYR_04255 [Phycicoccus sp.]
MNRSLTLVLGLVLVFFGVLWTLQGLGYVGGSFMSGSTFWAVVGPLVALAGVALAGFGRRWGRGR